jgi:hypothetical protein
LVPLDFVRPFGRSQVVIVLDNEAVQALAEFLGMVVHQPLAVRKYTARRFLRKQRSHHPA